MKHNLRVLCVAVALGSFAMNSTANAGCSRSAMLGTWNGSIATINAQNSANNYTAYCKFVIKRKARDVNLTGSCTALSSNPQINGQVNNMASESLLVEKDCTVHGTTISSLGGTSTIYGHINNAKNVFVASYTNSTLGVGIMSLVK